ncbi:hypothetical protein RhiirA4_493233 [Rhizophagus irregularis]|uniref:HAT C-terminal dimerisation domain-containing protein n=1 Tax=Rhizophagus irregularis TaxID=588596 RepID=A0A2I1HXM7_9GLOM|nr:hypothetical protein RhiirA4_493233 [Rhizophagus irregularis]
MACEQTFSVVGNTNTKTRNRINPETARATLCQNHGLKTEWKSFKPVQKLSSTNIKII